MIKRAILSVSDKTGITQLARRLADRGVTLLSTGGTMKAIADAGIPVTGRQRCDGFPRVSGWAREDAAPDDSRGSARRAR